MKSDRAFFFRHGGICRPMCFPLQKPGPKYRFSRPGSAQTVKDAPESFYALLIVATSSDRLFLRRVASPAVKYQTEGLDKTGKETGGDDVNAWGYRLVETRAKQERLSRSSN